MHAGPLVARALNRAPAMLLVGGLLVAGVVQSAPQEPAPGDPIGDPQLLTSLSREQLEGIRLATPLAEGGLQAVRNGVRLYKVSYHTRGSAAERPLVRASGLLAVPVSEDGEEQSPLPLLSFQHGTQFLREKVPSRVSDEAATGLLVYAAQGYVMAAADYIGLGDSTDEPVYAAYDFPPLEASGAADLLTACRRVLPGMGIQLSSQLFLAGYSQGGQATLALHRHLQQQEVPVTASAPMAGAYDLSGTTMRIGLRNVSPAGPALLTAILLSVNHNCGLYETPEEVFVPEVASRLQALFDGTHDIPEVMAGLPPDFEGLLQPKFLRRLMDGDPSLPFLQKLATFDTHSWRPAEETRIRLYHGDADVLSPYENSVTARRAMTGLGATNVELISIRGADHAAAQVPSFVGSLEFFESLRLP